jgi:serine/threonine protein kinase
MKADHIDFDNRKLYVFFQPMDMNLTQFIKKRFKRGKGRLDETNEIKVITRQILLGMKYLNEELGILHRDLKPDNIMINENPLSIKIIDFGTCKDLSVETGPHTSYVSTRWYRAPECVHHYNFNSDIFAVGCVMAEMYLGHPLFPGTSELD